MKGDKIFLCSSGCSGHYLAATNPVTVGVKFSFAGTFSEPLATHKWQHKLIGEAAFMSAAILFFFLLLPVVRQPTGAF